MMKNTYSLAGLKACIAVAREAIKVEPNNSIEAIKLFPGRYVVHFATGGWHDRKYEICGLPASLAPIATDHLSRHHQEGLLLDAHQVLNCIF